jgi:hypothetical protein
MITELGTIQLKNGESMEVKLLLPPEMEWGDRLLRGFLHDNSGF